MRGFSQRSNGGGVAYSIAELRVINSFNKLTFAAPGGTASIRMQIFADKFGAPGFVRRNFVENGTLDPRTAINSTDGGKTDLQVLAMNYKQTGDEPLKVNAYRMRSELDRYSNRASTTPIAETLPGQALQQDDRTTFGGSVEKYARWSFRDGAGAALFVGAGIRHDVVASKIFNSIKRTSGVKTENTDFTLFNPFAYAQADHKLNTWVKLTAGLRYDRLEFDIHDRQRGLDVAPSIDIVQPKAGIVFSPLRGLSLFANYGKSFLPPSATGGQLSRNPALDALRLATKEVGVQYKSADGAWQVLADVYRTTFTNEILNQTPPLLPIYLGPSRRDGFDVEARARVCREGGPAASVFINYSKVDDELVGRATGTRIPDVAEAFLKHGFDLAWPLGGVDSPRVIAFSASQVWEGRKPLNTTGTLETKTFSRVDAKLTYTDRNWKGGSVFLALAAYPDRRLDETAFTFGTPATVGVSPKARLTLQAGTCIPF